ncbi:MAG: hypothetical protein A6F72_04890 [Cycloclasticus sp. symbiont of Poecilosclerida sp. N]|nr:MAG: hypothetical protein A6F72_04890 [Cycloclasticus sp. symbiont of Poecilosclerida sp. N]
MSRLLLGGLLCVLFTQQGSAQANSHPLPGQVTGLQAQSSQQFQRLRWSVPTGAGITGYDIQRRLHADAAFGESFLATAVTTNSHLYFELRAAIFSYRVRARNADGAGAWSDAVTARPNGFAVPQGPQGPQAPQVEPTAVQNLIAVRSGTGVILGWSEPETKGFEFIGYDVSRRSGGDARFRKLTRGGPIEDLTYTDGAAVALSADTYRVVAHNINGSSEEVTVTIVAQNPGIPVANARASVLDKGENLIEQGATVTLDGSFSADADANDVLSYEWEQTEGEPVSLSDPEVVNPTFRAGTSGQVEFRLTVTDLGENTGATTITLTVDTSPQLQELQSPQNYSFNEEIERLTLPAAQGGNAPLRYSLGGLPVGLDFDEGTRTVFGTPTEARESDATYFVSYTVLDNDDDVAVRTFTIKIPAANPIANAGQNRTVNEGAIVTLNGIGSTDPEGQPLTYRWTQVVNGAPLVTLRSTVNSAEPAKSANPTFTAPELSTSNPINKLVFNLEVTDSAGAKSVAVDANSAFDSVVTITVNSVNNAPTARAGVDQPDMLVGQLEVLEGATVTLDGTDSSDPENEDLTYFWTQVTNGAPRVTLNRMNPAKPTFTLTTQLVSNAELVFSLTVFDGVRYSSSADRVTIAVTAGANDAPTADAGRDQTDVLEGATVTLDGTGSSDPENEDLTYVWTQQGGVSVALSDSKAAKPTFSAPTQLVSNAVLEFSLTVTDKRGLESTANAVTITVAAGVNDAPTANAGVDQSVTDVFPVVLNGSASSDPEDQDLRYFWTQVNNGAPRVNLPIDPPDPARPTFTTHLVSNAELVFSLTVFDGVRYSAADRVTIAVTAGANDRPLADAGPNQPEGAATITEGDTVTLNGLASSDPENEALTYAWTQQGGEPTVTLSDSKAAKPTFIAPDLISSGNVYFSLMVTDARGLMSIRASNVVITVTADNDPPIANAGPDQRVSGGTVVTLDGSESSDPEKRSIVHAWSLIEPDPQTGLGLEISTALRKNFAKPTFTAPVLAGDATTPVTLVFSLVVTERIGTNTLSSEADQVSIIVGAPSSAPPIAYAGRDRTEGDGTVVTLDGSGSRDPEGQANLTYKWTQVNTPKLTLRRAKSVNPNFTAPELSADIRLVFRLIVNDGVRDSVADEVTITVRAENDRPIADAGEDRSVGDGQLVTLDGSGSSDPERLPLTAYVWRQIRGQDVLRFSNNDNANPTVTFTAPEVSSNTELQFRLYVRDDKQTSLSDVVTIIVTPQNDRPLADAGRDQPAADAAPITEGATVTLNGLASSDPENKDLTYHWTQVENGAPRITLNRMNPAEPTFVAPEVNPTNTVLEFSLTVEDDTQDSAMPDTVTITVTPGPNDRPLADAGPDQPAADAAPITEGAMVTLDGSGSSDPEEERLSYRWTQDENGAPRVDLKRGATVDPNFTVPDLLPGVKLAFSLVVTDARGLPSTNNPTVTITVAAENGAPTAHAGSEQPNVAEGTHVFLNGRLSSDPEGQGLGYTWTQIEPAEGLPGSGINLGDVASPSFTVPDLLTNTNLVFSLVVNDGEHDSSNVARVVIAVTADNDAPTAHAGPDQPAAGAATIAEGAMVTLDGSRSSDPEGEDLVTYVWTQIAPEMGLEGSGIMLDDVVDPSFTAPDLTMDTQLIFSLTVTDRSDGMSSTGAVDCMTDTDACVIIAVTANQRPTAEAGGDLAVDDGNMVTLRGAASNSVGPVTYRWTQTGGQSVAFDRNAARPTFTAPEVLANRELVFSLIVSDSRGASLSDTVTITVTAMNDAPTADAGPDQPEPDQPML